MAIALPNTLQLTILVGQLEHSNLKQLHYVLTK